MLRRALELAATLAVALLLHQLVSMGVFQASTTTLFPLTHNTPLDTMKSEGQKGQKASGSPKGEARRTVTSEAKAQVQKEKEELDAKIVTLKAFLITPKYAELPDVERFRLKHQNDLMDALSDILGKRIKADFK